MQGGTGRGCCKLSGRARRHQPGPRRVAQGQGVSAPTGASLQRPPCPGIGKTGSASPSCAPLPESKSCVDSGPSARGMHPPSQPDPPLLQPSTHRCMGWGAALACKEGSPCTAVPAGVSPRSPCPPCSAAAAGGHAGHAHYTGHVTAWQPRCTEGLRQSRGSCPGVGGLAGVTHNRSSAQEGSSRTETGIRPALPVAIRRLPAPRDPAAASAPDNTVRMWEMETGGDVEEASKTPVLLRHPHAHAVLPGETAPPRAVAEPPPAKLCPIALWTSPAG